MPSLSDLQQRFCEAVFAADGVEPAFAIADATRGAERMAVYRRTIFANYRNALAATYPVVLRLVGTPFFNAAVGEFVRAHPSRSGDLNVYGDVFGDFLAAYSPAAGLPYLADVGRLEWAVDEANRAADTTRAPDTVLRALAMVPAEHLPALRLRVEPSCRLIASDFPILRIWQANQPDRDGDPRVALDDGPDQLAIHRDATGILLERVNAGEFAWLAALVNRAPLVAAIEKAQAADATFDLGAALRRYIGNGTIAAIVDDG